jgi:hypothetical protein
MKKSISVLAVMLLALATFAFADVPGEGVSVETGIGIGVGITPTNSCPMIVQEHCSSERSVEGGSVCYHVDTHADYESLCNVQADCVQTLTDNMLNAGIIGRSYAFEGEQVHFEVAVMDMDGINSDCVQVYVTLDNGYDPIEAACVLVGMEDWTDPHTQAVFEDVIGHFACIYTVEPAESGTVGEYWISVRAVDGCGAGCMDQSPGVISLYLNPAVSLTISAQDQFGFMYDANGNALASVVAGQTVYSPYFTVENSAEPSTGLYMLLQLYGTDMWDYDSSGALCPTSNVLDIRNVEYKASHLNVQQPWTVIPRNLANKFFVFNDGNTDKLSTPVKEVPSLSSNVMGNFLGVGDDVTMRLRLNIPTPCKGNFDDGGQIVFAGQVI